MIAKPFASLVAAAAAVLAAPALAHDPAPLPALEAVEGEWEGEWQGTWDGPESYRGVWHGTYTGLDGIPVEAEYRGRFIGESHFLSDEGHALRREGRRWREERGPAEWRHGPMAPWRYGYSMEERAAWLDECRARYAEEVRYGENRGRERGTGIGGLLGAIGGGIAGNRIAGRGDRAAGTLIGAGVGAVAGAAAGRAIGEDADRRRADALDRCEAYLRRYEADAVHHPGYGPGYAPGPGAYAYPAYAYHGPVMMVRVPIHRERVRDCGCEEVIEEVVETVPASRPARRVAPAAVKRVPATPDKRVRVGK